MLLGGGRTALPLGAVESREEEMSRFCSCDDPSWNKLPDGVDPRENCTFCWLSDLPDEEISALADMDTHGWTWEKRAKTYAARLVLDHIRFPRWRRILNFIKQEWRWR